MNPLILVCVAVLAIIIVGALTVMLRSRSKGGRP